MLLADWSYDADALRKMLRAQGMCPVIPGCQSCKIKGENKQKSRVNYPEYGAAIVSRLPYLCELVKDVDYFFNLFLLLYSRTI